MSVCVLWFATTTLALSPLPTPGERRTVFGTPLMRASRASWPAGVGVGVGVQVLHVGVGVTVGVTVTVGETVGVGGHCPVPTGVQVGVGVAVVVGVGVGVGVRVDEGVGHCPVPEGVQVAVGGGVGQSVLSDVVVQTGVEVTVGVGVGVGDGVGVTVSVGVGVEGHCPVPTGVQVGVGVGESVGVGVGVGVSVGVGVAGLGVGVGVGVGVGLGGVPNRSWRKTSPTPLLSPGTRLVDNESNATKRPSTLISGCWLRLFPCVPSLATLARSVVPVWRSRTKTSGEPLVSPGTRLQALDRKATKRASPLTNASPALSPIP